jgi:hypothetical protein
MHAMRHEIFFSHAAAESTKLLPVKSSQPAITAKLKAEEKAIAAKIFAADPINGAINPPMLKATMLPKVINIPATIDEIM